MEVSHFHYACESFDENILVLYAGMRATEVYSVISLFQNHVEMCAEVTVPYSQAMCADFPERDKIYRC